MSADAYGLEGNGTGGWLEQVEDHFMAVDRQLGTTHQADLDRYFAARPWMTATLEGARGFVSLVDPGGPRPLPAPLEAKLVELAVESARPGWDGERGLAVASSAWEDARTVLRRLPEGVLRSPALHVSMSGDGFVHVAVSRPGRGVATLEVGHGKYYWNWVRGMDEDETAELSSLLEAASRLADFTLSP